MVTGMDSLLAQGRRGELTQEIYSGRLERGLRKVHRPGRGRRWAFWLPRETDASNRHTGLAKDTLFA